VRQAAVRATVLALTCATLVVGLGDTSSFLGAARAGTARVDGKTLNVRVVETLPIRQSPGAGRVIGWMPASSRYYHQSMRPWVLRMAKNGRYGLVAVPYVSPHRQGWIKLHGLVHTRTGIRVNVDLSRHTVAVRHRGHLLFRVRATTGAPATPTPTGRYFVTDRVAFSQGDSYGSYAFGISGIQSRLPAAWDGGDQLAIHGTNDPSSIGESASAGCIRVSEKALDKLKPLLRRGTPVVISP
jgi:lipoprotein-anchoring transpeptidase ErfK/SrfK